MKKTYIIAFLFSLIDVISKQIINHFLELHKSIEIIKNFFYITYTKNTGAAWSLLKDERLILLIFTVIVIFIIYKYLNKENLKNNEQFAYGMIIGGILGNFFDRLIYGYVIDFLDFKIFSYNYPIFNFADSFIVIGIIILIIIEIRKDKNERNNSHR
jgi:signal peptidase II